MKAKEAREMSIADLKDQIQLKKSNLDTMKNSTTRFLHWRIPLILARRARTSP